MSEDAKLDKLIDMMESMMISVDKSINSLRTELLNEIGSLRTEMKIEFEETNRKIELVAENVTKTSNYELEKRVEVIEKKLGIA